jgi:hypothetical protein
VDGHRPAYIAASRPQQKAQMSQAQIERCSARILDPTTRAEFVSLLRRADKMVFEAAQMRLEGWAIYRDALMVGQYA